MQYITGIHALNLPCNLETSGDWHQSAIQWSHPQLRESDVSFYGSYGLEEGHHIPEHKDTYIVANTIRALLDLLYEQNFCIAQGMNKDFICNDYYDNEVFSKVYEMHVLPYWSKINDFMEKEYKMKWINFIKEKNKSLKIEISYRRSMIPLREMTNVSGITVYNINSLAIMKANAYSARDKIRDLYDLSFIINKYYEQLNPYVLDAVRSAFENKGIEQYDYVTATQSDELISNEQLADEFLKAYDKLGLISERDQNEILSDTSDKNYYGDDEYDSEDYDEYDYERPKNISNSHDDR